MIEQDETIACLRCGEHPPAVKPTEMHRAGWRYLSTPNTYKVWVGRSKQDETEILETLPVADTRVLCPEHAAEEGAW